MARQQAYDVTGASVLVGTGKQVKDYEITLVGAAAVDAASQLEVRLEVPPDARIETALFELVANPVSTSATLTSVADVRPATAISTSLPAAAVVDFGRLVTVGGIVLPDLAVGGPVIAEVRRWNGGQWSFVATSPTFAEIATDRLLVQASSGTGDALAARLRSAGVLLPAGPSGLELLLDGRTVWFERQGSGPVDVATPVAAAAGGARFVVDRTDAVREAFARVAAGRAPGDPAPLVLQAALRVATPGRLSLRPQLSTLRTHVQDFPPEGVTRTTDLTAEGEVEVELTPPAALTVHEVTLRVRGRFGPERVSPAVGPAISGAARLVLAAGRSVLVGLPRAELSRFTTVSGIRLRLAASADGGGGGQLTGRLLTAPGGDRPGDPLAGADLAPLTVTDAQPGWYTLPFARPVRPPRQGPADEPIGAWLELAPGYGELECALTAAPVDGAEAPGAPVRRRLSGGGTGPLTPVPALGPLLVAVRIVGTPDRNHPIAAVRLSLSGAAEAIEIDPTGDDLVAVLIPAAPVPVPAAGPPVRLTARCSAAGSLVLDTVQITYRERKGQAR